MIDWKMRLRRWDRSGDYDRLEDAMEELNEIERER